MADKLNVYKGAELVASAERGAEGKATVSIDGLEANTDYPAGTYTVAFENENGESSKTDVPAFKTKAIRVSGVTVEPTTLSLTVGDSQAVTPTVAPSTATDKTVEYTTADQAVATVNASGEITAVGAGETTITATTTDGSKTATVTVTVEDVVEPEPEEPENVDVTPNENDADVSAE